MAPQASAWVTVRNPAGVPLYPWIQHGCQGRPPRPRACRNSLRPARLLWPRPCSTGRDRSVWAAPHPLPFGARSTERERSFRPSGTGRPTSGRGQRQRQPYKSACGTTESPLLPFGCDRFRRYNSTLRPISGVGLRPCPTPMAASSCPRLVLVVHLGINPSRTIHGDFALWSPFCAPSSSVDRPLACRRRRDPEIELLLGLGLDPRPGDAGPVGTTERLRADRG